MARASAQDRDGADDDQPIFRAWDSFVDRCAEPGGESQPDRLCRMVERGSCIGYGDPGAAGREPTRTNAGRIYSRCDRNSINRVVSAEEIA